jgi:acylaminoacyl-peptidase
VWRAIPLPAGSKWHHTSGEFATLAASPDGTMALLCGELKREEDKGDDDDNNNNNNSNNNSNNNNNNNNNSGTSAGKKGTGEPVWSKNGGGKAKRAGQVHRGDWGELLYDAEDPRLFVVDLAAGKLADVDTDHAYGPRHACGQGVWIDDGAIAFTVYERPSRNRPGLRYCVNRRSSVARVCLETGEFATLSDQSEGDARCPIVLPGRGEVAFLETRARGDADAHGSASLLRVRDARCEREIRDVITVVDTPESPEAFQGLFTGGFVRNAARFAPGKLVIETLWRTAVRVLVVDVETGDLQVIGPETELVGAGTSPARIRRALHVLDVCEGAILCSTSDPVHPASAILVTDAANTADTAAAHRRWHAEVVLDAPREAKEALANLRVTELRGAGFEALLVEPSAEARPERGAPLLAFPHGGPHSAFSGDFFTAPAFLALSGYAVLEINYRGSTGFGMEFLLALRGNAGIMDVEDCLCAVGAALARGGLDPQRVGVIGGSHGGFLGAHLSAVVPTAAAGGAQQQQEGEGAAAPRFPGPFRCAVLRNPVIDIATMSGTTDIPDWCASVTGTASLDEMRARSPIAHVGRVRGAVLLMIGLKDLRVPPAQGYQFWRALDDLGKARACELIAYDSDSHPLSTPATQIDVHVRTAAWLDEHMSV